MTALQTVVITGTFDDGSGSPLNGALSFTPTSTVYSSGVPVLQVGVPVVGQIINGALKNSAGESLSLVATDNTGLSVEGLTGWWAWNVVPTINGAVQPSWSFFLPYSAEPVDLYSLANQAMAGFPNPLTALGDLLVGGEGGSPERLAGNASATREFLISEGTGTEAQAQFYGPLDAGDIPDTAVTPGSYTNTSLTVGADGRLTAASSGSAGGVASFNSRTGAVAPASGDYSVGQVTGAAPLASPALTGTPTAPTAGALSDSTQVATTAYADAAVGVETSRAETAEALLAPKANPTFTGTPAAPTASPLSDSTQLATTAYADSAVAVETSRAEVAEALRAPLASPALTGSPTAPTQTTGDNSTKIATDAFVATAVATETTRAETAEALLAPKASPTFTGTPAGPTAAGGTNTTQLATTAYAYAAAQAAQSAAEAASLPLAGGTLTGPVAGFEDKGGQVFNVKAYGAAGNGVVLTNAAMTASSATLTSSGASFTSGNVGMDIVVQGAGAAGASLVTTISGYTSATTVTLAATASTTVTAATAYYGTDDSAAFASCAAAAVAAGGGLAYVPAGDYLAAAIPLQSTLFWQGAGFDASRIYLANGNGASSMFVAPAAVLASAGIRDLGLYGDGSPTGTYAISSTSARRCIDLSAATSCQQFPIHDNFISGFSAGYYGSQNDRYIPFYGNRVWFCVTGIMLNLNHPEIGINDIRYNGAGVAEVGNGIVDMQFTGTKFCYNLTGVNLSGSGCQRNIFVGCQFFGNVTYGAYVNAYFTFTACLFFGSFLGSNTTTQYLLAVGGAGCTVTGCLFPGGIGTAAIYAETGAISLVIEGNTFTAESTSQIPATSGIIAYPNGSGTNWQQPVIADNTFILLVDVSCLYTTSSLEHPVITGNSVYYSAASAGVSTLFYMAGSGGGGYIFALNTTFASNATGPILQCGSSIRSVIMGNRHRNPNATVYTLGTTDVNTRLVANFGYDGTVTGAESYLLGANNLSDLASAATAMENLGAAPLASPVFTGVPQAPTAPPETSTTQLATTAFVENAVATGGQVVSGQYLCPPTAYAPATQAILTVTGTTFAAFSSASVNTGSFTAPASGSVVVTASFASTQSSGSTVLSYGLCAHGTVTPLVANSVNVTMAGTTYTTIMVTAKFLVTGLTPGDSYNFDLVGACGTAGDKAEIYAYGNASTTTPGTAGAPVIMTVQAV